MARYNHEGIQFLSDTRTHHYHKRIRIYACSFKYQEQAVDVDSPFSNCSSQTCHLFILESLHIPRLTMGTVSDCVDYKCLYGNSVVYLYKRLHFLSFPNKQTNETLLVCFLWSSSSMALIRQETYMYTNNDCFKNNDVWMNYSKFVNISYA